MSYFEELLDKMTTKSNSTPTKKTKNKTVTKKKKNEEEESLIDEFVRETYGKFKTVGEANLKNGVSTIFSDTPTKVGGGGRSISSSSEKDEEEDKREFLGLDLFQKSGAWEGYEPGKVTDVKSFFDEANEFNKRHSQATLGTMGDVALNILQGGLNFAEGIGDVGGYLIAEAHDLFGADEAAKEIKKNVQQDAFGMLTQPLHDAVEKTSWLGETTDQVGQGVGQVLATMGIGAIGKAAGATPKVMSFLSKLAQGTSAFGNAMSEAYKGGATDGEALGYGAISATAEVLFESLFDGMGKTAKSLGFDDISLTNGADDWVASKVSSFIKNPQVKNVVQGLVKGGFEGVEELLTGFVQGSAKKIYDDEKTWGQLLKDENLWEQFFVGMLTGDLMQAGDVTKANKSGRDLITGLNADETTVVNKIVDERIEKKAKETGKELTGKQKAETREQAMEDLENGSLDVDDIERILGGDSYTAFDEAVKGFEGNETYKAYKDALAEEKALQSEFDELGKVKSTEASLGQNARFNELQQKLAELKQNSKSGELRTHLQPEIDRINQLKAKARADSIGRLEGSKLLESYMELARSGEKFKVDDFSKYKSEHSKQTINNILASGLANNTKKMHQFVDFIAKISEEKGVVFSLTDAKKLAGTVNDFNGATANGFIVGNEITVNMDSKKKLNTIVGHEITHALEGTDFYDTLADVVKTYAVTKGEWDTRLANTTELYKKHDPNADPVKEVVADLVGEYVFTDSTFLSNLSTKNRNVFQKIYDEIKWMCKIATAGSEEARKLVEVKKIFDKVWRESNTNTDNSVKHDIAVLENGNIYVKASRNVITGQTKTEQRKNITDFFNDLLEGNSSLDIPTIEGDVLTITKAQTADKARDDHKIVDGQRIPLTDDEFLVKLHIEAHIDEMAEVSKPSGGKGDNKNHSFAKSGFTYRRAYFEDFDGQYYEVTLSVGNNGTTATVYNVGKFEGSVLPSAKLIAVVGSKPLGKTLPSNDIAQNAQNVNTKNSLSETDGNQLSTEQEDFFKDSVVRDENGNLKVMYHGTSNGGYTVFDTYGSKYGLFGAGSYFTDSKNVAEKYTNKHNDRGNDNKQVYETYLNIKKPMDMDAQADPAEWAKVFPEASFPESGTNEDFFRAMEEYFYDMMYTKGEASDEVIDAMTAMGYDGLTHIGGNRINPNGEQHRVYIAFHPEQIKNIDNANPTSDPDIRYSISEDSEGNKLSAEQNDFFKDSLMRDENGNLKVMYHGTTDGGFHTFDSGYSDDDTSFFFTDRNDVASSYSGTSETYTAKTFHTADDFNQFFAEIGATEYSVVEENGKFKLLEDGDEIAESDTPAGLYEEFRDWSGKGYGEVNYKVYLNLKNPLVVDAKGANWRSLPGVDGGTQRYDYIMVEEVYDDGSVLVEYAMSGDPFPVTQRVDLWQKFGDSLGDTLAEMGPGESLDGAYANPSTTRDYAKYAKENGYDGVVFKNIVDNGGYSNGREGTSTVAIAFDSNQIKSVGNTNPTPDNDIRYSLTEDTKLADKAIAKNDVYGFLDSNTMTLAKAMRERVAQQLREMKDNGVAIPDDIKGNTAISNSSYDITEENTTICPRSLAAESFVDAVSEYLGRPLTVEEQIYISQDLQGRSLTPECTYCYVATDRKAYRQFLGEYIKQRDAVLEKIEGNPNADITRGGELYKDFLNGRKDTDPMYKRFKMWVDAYKSGKPLIDGSHLANMNRLMGDINEFGAELKPQIVDAMKYAQSASWAKKRVSYVAYDGHILKWKQNRIDKLNSHYGLRMYSFSDFHPAFVLENMQMITDAAVRGLKVLGYTKDTDFVEIFAPSGMNINISTFGFESGGNVYENNIIGANWEKAKALREQNPNVGITFVATSDSMVEWALEQDWVDVVIPYHLVRTGEAVANAFDYKNFTNESSDTKDKGWSKDNDSKYIAPTEHNNDKATYLAALAKNNLKPRFERWLNNPNYMKLVNECRQTASESKPVQPKFNEDAINTALAKLKANGYYQPVGGSVDRMYEIAAQVAENMQTDLQSVDTSQRGWVKDLPVRNSITEDGYVDSNVGDYAVYGSDVKLRSQEDFGFNPLGDIAPVADTAQNVQNTADVPFDAPVAESAEQAFAPPANTLPPTEDNSFDAPVNEAPVNDDGYMDSLVASEPPPANDFAPVMETPVRQPVMDAPVKQNIPNGTRVRASDRGNIGVVQGYDPASNTYSVAFRSKDGATATVSLPANAVTPLEQNNGQNNGQKTDSKAEKVSNIVKTKHKLEELFVDKGAAVERLAKKTKNRELEAKYNFMHYSEARAQQFLADGDPERGVRGMLSIMKDVGERDGDFHAYLYHIHNMDRMTLQQRGLGENKAVFGSNVTAQMSSAIAQRIEAQNPDFRQLATEVYGINQHLRQMMVNKGIISQQTANRWAQMYPHYVPISRADQEALLANYGQDNHTGVNAPVKRATGGDGEISPLFNTMASRILQTYKAVDKNSFGVELMQTLGTVSENSATDMDGIMDAIDTHENLLQVSEDGTPTFSVFVNGQRVKFNIDNEMYNALSPTNEFFAGTSKILNGVSNFRRGLITEYNPVFAVTNALKDAQDVLINSQHPLLTYANMPRAIAQMIGKGKWFKEYMANGGEQNSYFEKETRTFQKEKSTLRKVVGFPLDAISAVNNFIERIPRLAEYIASREHGRSIEVAMLDSARVTTNFAAGGDVTKWANRNGFTFLNASVQGAAQQIRNIQEARMEGAKGWAKLAGKTIVAGLPALLLNGLLWDDDEEYEELSDYVKENYYIVGKFGDGQFVRIPKGRTVAVIQEAIRQVTEGDIDPAKFGELVISNLAPNDPMNNFVLAPIIQASTNTAWHGGDIVPQSMQDVPEEEQYDESTDSLSRWLGEKLGGSPMKWNYVLDQYSGGVGDLFLPMMTPEAERGEDSVLGKLASPWVDKFTTDSTLNNQNVTDFYDLKDELTINANSSKATDNDLLMSSYMNSISSELNALYKEKREIQNSRMSDAEKFAEARRVQQEIVDTMKNAMSTYEDISYKRDAKTGEQYALIGDKVFKRYNGEYDHSWRILDQEQTEKYRITSAAGNANYATDGTTHYAWYVPDEDAVDKEPAWRKLTEKQVDKMNTVARKVGITPEEYWTNRDEDSVKMYDWVYENPEKVTVAKAVADDFNDYWKYRTDLNNLDGKDDNGNSVNGLKKRRITEYISGLDIDYGQKIILFRSYYPKDDSYCYDIVDYLNGRKDISYRQMVTILEELDMKVHDDGTVTWD